jgi:hypothetical protein
MQQSFMKINLVRFPPPNRRDVKFLQTNVKVAHQNEFIIGIFFYFTQMSLTRIIGPLSAYAFFIGEREMEGTWEAAFVTGRIYYTNPLRDVSVGHGPVRKHVCAILRGIAGKVVCLPTFVALVVRAYYDVMQCSQ